MSRDRDALLRTILASPDDDAPRLVYADWLTENGEGDRGEFVRVQCELDRGPPGLRCTKIAPTAWPATYDVAPWPRPNDHIPVESGPLTVCCQINDKPNAPWVVVSGTLSAPESIGGLRLIDCGPFGAWERGRGLAKRAEELAEKYGVTWIGDLPKSA